MTMANDGFLQEPPVSAVDTSVPNIFWGNDDNSLHLGVIVDRTAFDGDDDLKDIPQIFDVENRGATSDSEGVVVRNGKVRRKLRWKPPGFRKKRNNQNNKSSNSSVISNLTNRSSSSRSMFSQFSRRSQNSFHTFHSTETAKATNKERRPKAPHTVKRPNYRDTFDSQAATIDNDGSSQHMNVKTRRSDSSKSLDTVETPTVFVRSSTMPTNLDDEGKPFDPSGSSHSVSNNSEMDPFDVLSDLGATATAATRKANIPLPKKKKKSMRPPLFKRKSKKNPEDLSQTTEEATSSKSSASASLNVVMSRNDTEPTISNSESPLDLELSEIPVLESEDLQEDRNVFLGSPSPSRGNDDDGESDAGGSTLTPHSAITPESPHRSPAHLQSSTPVLDSILEQSQPTLATTSPRKAYNRPIDRTAMPNDLITTNLVGSEVEAQVSPPPTAAANSPARNKTSIPVDLDDGAFVEAEHNLLAIHKMAAEHLAHDEFEEAIEVFEEVLRAQRQLYGQTHYRVGTALHNLGVVHLKRQDYPKAIAIFEEAVEVRKQALVPDHPDAAISLAQLGVANLESGNFQMALLPFRESLNIRKGFLGPQHPKCCKLLNNIGCCLYSLNELDDARIVFEEALNGQRATLRSLPSLEDAHEQQLQSLQQQQEAHQEPLPQSNNILLSMASTLCNLGSINLKKGQFEDATVALEEALLLQQSVLGDDHPMIKSTADCIAFVEKSKEQSETASLLPNWFAMEEPQISMEDSMCQATPSWFISGESATEIKEDSLCRASPNMEEVLGTTILSSLSPKSWFRRMENVFSENNTCGQMTSAAETACGSPPTEVDDPTRDSSIANSIQASENSNPEDMDESAHGYSV